MQLPILMFNLNKFTEGEDFAKHICITSFRNTLTFGMGFPKKQSAFRTIVRILGINREA